MTLGRGALEVTVIIPVGEFVDDCDKGNDPWFLSVRKISSISGCVEAITRLAHLLRSHIHPLQMPAQHIVQEVTMKILILKDQVGSSRGFVKVVNYFNRTMTYIPLDFMLGFFVTQVVSGPENR